MPQLPTPRQTATQYNRRRMSIVAVLGAGPIGAGVAHALARHARVRDVRLIDSAGSVARGKALDIRQSGPVEGFDTRVAGEDDVLAAVAADVIVVADEHEQGPWDGDRGLAMLARLRRSGATAPLVLAAPGQWWLAEAAVREAGVAADAIVGASAGAMAGAARALAALEIEGSGVDVTLPVCGRPPRFTLGWSSAMVGQSLAADRIPPHRQRAVSDHLAAHWPPGPYAIATVTAPIVEGLLTGTRRDVCGVTVLDGELGVRGVACLLPLTLGHRRVLARRIPSLSPQERTALLSGLSA
jgi:malate dehydrogenase